MLAVLALAFAVAAAGAPRTVEGKIVRISDGDTVDLLVNRTTLRLRLYGIDAPERGQPYASVAKRQLGDWIAGEHVRATLIERDRYGRHVARIEHRGRDISERMVGAGLAWWYRAHAPRDRRLERLEEETRQSRRGLWAQPAIPPWEWRKK